MGLFDRFTEAAADKLTDKLKDATTRKLADKAEQFVQDKVVQASQNTARRGMERGMAEMGIQDASQLPDPAALSAMAARMDLASMTPPDPSALANVQQQVMGYAQEQQRIQSVGVKGTAVIQAVTPIPDAPAVDPSMPWMHVTAQISVPGQAPYVATVAQMVPGVTAAMYAPGTTHAVAVDPANPSLWTYSG